MRSGAEPTVGEIERVVRSHLNISKHVQEASGPHVIADCPFCGKVKHLYVNMESGAWDCKVCGESGGFWKLADKLGVRVRSATVVRSTTSVLMASRANTSLRPTMAPAKPLADGPHLGLAKVTGSCDALFLDSGDGPAVLAYLRSRGFTDDTIRRFKLGLTYIFEDKEREPAVGIPYIEDGKVPMMKMRNLATEKDKRKFRRTKGGESRLFNVDAVKGVRRAVLVEGELDAISLHQAGITTVASTSLGAKKNIPPEWMMALDDVDEIVLWYDADDAGQESVHALTEVFGTWRVKLASIDEELAASIQRRTGKRPKDVNDLLLAGVDHAVIRAIVDAALPIDNTAVVTADRYADPLLDIIDHAEESLGTPTGLDVLDTTVRGWRDQELIVVTGHTSHGKSTAVQDRLEWLADLQQPVLLTALENGPLALARKMFQRRYGGPISGIKTEVDKERARGVIATMNRNPVHILDVYGRISMDALCSNIEDSVRRHKTKRVMIDHLGYILPRDERKDEREGMDDILMELTELTRKLNCTIFLIAHPRSGVDATEIPTGDSIRGTSSAKQLCDVGITVWRDLLHAGDSVPRDLKLKTAMGRMDVTMAGDEALFYVWKVRHDEGVNGSGVMKYNKGNLKYAPRPDATAQEPDPRLPREDGPQQSLSIDPFADIPFSDGEGNK